jgi:hypothetical protein
MLRVLAWVHRNAATDTERHTGAADRLVPGQRV